MKKHVFAIAMLAAAFVASAQYTPNTKWPYVLENFENGVLHRGTDHSEEAMFNIHFTGNTLHYVNPTDQKIYTAKYNKIDSVVMNSGTFVQSIDGQMMRVEARRGENMVLKLEYADLDALNTNTGAYGLSLNSSATRKLSSLGTTNASLIMMLQERNDGTPLVIRTKYYLRIGDKDIEANKGAIEDFLTDDKKEGFKLFLKQNKIKWKKPESLAVLLQYFE